MNVQLLKEFQTHQYHVQKLKMLSQRCLRVIVGILNVLEGYNHTDAELWRQILELFDEVISMLEADFFGPDVQMEEEQEEIDH